MSARLKLAMVLFVVTAIPAISNGQTIPDNSTTSPYSVDGWKCDKGYKKSGSSCAKIIVPMNATLSPYDYVDGWKCDSGYLKNGNNCDKIILPENATLNPYDFADGWTCDRGYLKNGDNCDKIILPKNATLNPYDFADGWTCDRGYKKNGNSCKLIVVPLNASISPYGQGWVCNLYFKKNGSECVAMNEAERAEYDLYMALVEQAARSRNARSRANQNCDTEPDTDSEVCVRVVDTDIDCSENYEGTYYDSCEVEVDYIVETDYSGSGSIDVQIRCEIEIEYESATLYSGSGDEDFRDSITLYAHDSHSASEDVDFSFYYEEPTSVAVSEARCKIYDLSR